MKGKVSEAPLPNITLAEDQGLLEQVGAGRWPRYPEYKDSGIECISQIPCHWEYQRLKFMTKVIMGQSPPSEEYNTEAVGLPFLQGNAEFGDLYPKARYFCPSASKIAPKGALLFSVRAPVGALNFADQKYGIGRGLCSIIPNPNVLIPNFAWYALHVSRTELISLATGSIYDAVSVNEVENVFLILPKLEEQRAISDFLNRETARIDELIAKKQRLIDLLQEKRTALISQAVTKGLNPNAPMKASGIDWLGEIPSKWIVCKLGFISTAIQTGPFGSQLHSHEYVDDEIPVINPTNLINGKIVPDPKATVNKEVYERLKRHELKNGDIVFGRRGEMGRCSLVSEKESGWLCGTGSLLVRPKQPIVKPSYLTAFLSTTGVSDFLSLRSVGSTMENLNSKILGSIPVCLPSIEEQEQIDCFIQIESGKHENLVQKIQNAISVLIEYRSSLFSAAVTGKIDVRLLGNESVTT